MLRTTLLLLSAVLTVACGSVEDDRVTNVDTGNICMFVSDTQPPSQGLTETVMIEDGDRLSIEVSMCAPCGSDFELTCEAARDGSTLHVTSTASHIPPEGDTACLAICNIATTTCEIGELEAGEYELRYGDDTHPVSVPASNTACPNGTP